MPLVLTSGCQECEGKIANSIPPLPPVVIAYITVSFKTHIQKKQPLRAISYLSFKVPEVTRSLKVLFGAAWRSLEGPVSAAAC